MAYARSSTIFIALAIAAGSVACGGAALSDLFSADGNSTVDSGGGGGNDTGVIGNDATIDPKADASVDPGPDVVPPKPDVFVPPVIGDNNGIVCGNTFCDSSQGFCCASRLSGKFLFSSYACVASNAACDNNLEAPLDCDGPEDCSGGKVCCGNLIISSAQRVNTWATTVCTKRNDCQGTFVDGGETFRNFIMCKPGSGTTECPSGGTCKDSQLLNGYGTCEGG
jgi:hypothetical protein